MKQLTTTPGVGVFSTLFFQAEIGSLERFRLSHELVAYAEGKAYHSCGMAFNDP